MTEDTKEPIRDPGGPDAAPQNPRRNMEYLFFVGLFVLWIVLQVWVLPKAGVPT